MSVLFLAPWWLDAAAPGRWGEVTVEKGGQVIGRLPYVTETNRVGWTYLTGAPLTQTLGPWIAPSQAKYAKQLAREKDIYTALIEKLPPHDYFEQNFHWSVTNWLPFYWKGFSQTTRYTYRFDDLSDLDTLWEGTLPNIRTDIRKAKKEVEIRDDLSLDPFLAAQGKVFSRQGLPSPPEPVIRRLDTALIERGQRKIFAAVDAQERIHATIYLAWANGCAYYLMGGSDPALRNSGATSLALWEAIKFASTFCESFDFEGSMLEPVERFFRAFGARQTPYFQVTWASQRMNRLKAAKRLFGLER